jgi:hypothetical protein
VSNVAQLLLDDGVYVLVEVEDDATFDGVDAEGLPESLKEVLERVGRVVSSVADTLTPDEIGLEVGLTGKAESGGVWKWVIGKVGGEGSVKVTFTWKQGGSGAASG